MDHTHNIGHNHNIEHVHGIAHTHNIPAHTHDIEYGIYEATTPQNVTIAIDGIDRTTALGGPFNSNQANLNLTSLVQLPGWHSLSIGSSRLGRINASLFIQALISV